MYLDFGGREPQWNLERKGGMGRGFHTDSSPPPALAAHLTLDKGLKNHNNGIAWRRWPEETVAEKGAVARERVIGDHSGGRSRVPRVPSLARPRRNRVAHLGWHGWQGLDDNAEGPA